MLFLKNESRTYQLRPPLNQQNFTNENCPIHPPALKKTHKGRLTGIDFNNTGWRHFNIYTIKRLSSEARQTSGVSLEDIKRSQSVVSIANETQRWFYMRAAIVCSRFSTHIRFRKPFKLSKQTKDEKTKGACACDIRTRVPWIPQLLHYVHIVIQVDQNYVWCPPLSHIDLVLLKISVVIVCFTGLPERAFHTSRREQTRRVATRILWPPLAATRWAWEKHRLRSRIAAREGTYQRHRRYRPSTWDALFATISATQAAWPFLQVTKTRDTERSLGWVYHWG